VSKDKYGMTLTYALLGFAADNRMAVLQYEAGEVAVRYAQGRSCRIKVLEGMTEPDPDVVRLHG
jgi:hypothetical protein